MSEQVTDLSNEEIDVVSGGGWGDFVYTDVDQSNRAINVSANVAYGSYYVNQYSNTSNYQSNYSNVYVRT